MKKRAIKAMGYNTQLHKRASIEMKYSIKIITILIIIQFASSCNTSKEIDYSWMDKYKAIICLTYDDGMVTQYKNAIPQLNKFELKGTFFLNNVSNREAVVAWRNASKNGHELGNHTLFHPCPKSLGWPKEVTTDNYSISLMLDEIRIVNSILDVTELQTKKRTFAYPCNNMFIGTTSYKEALENSNLVTYARTGSEEEIVINRKKNIEDPMSVPSWAVPEGANFLDLKRYVDKVVQEDGLGILQFHGVGGEWISISSETHHKLVEYLNKNEETILVTTFTEAMKYMEAKYTVY